MIRNAQSTQSQPVRVGPNRGRALKRVAAVLCAAVLHGSVDAQCFHWDPTGYPHWDTTYPKIVKYDMGAGPSLYVGSTNWSIGLFDVAKWTGAGWLSIGQFDDYIDGVAGANWGTGPNLVAWGDFTHLNSTGQYVSQLARWNGTSWIAMNPPIIWHNGINALCEFDDGTGPQLYIGGDFWPTSTIPNSHRIIRYNGTWSGVGGGLQGPVTAMCVYDDGSGAALYAATWIHVGGALASNLVKWDGVSWTTVVQATAPNHGIGQLQVYNDGTGPVLVMGGRFATLAGIPVNGLAMWDGASVRAFPGLPASGNQLTVVALAVHDDGNGACLYVSYEDFPVSNRMARWDGNSWIECAPPGGIPLVSFDDGMGAGPALWAGGYLFGGNVCSYGFARLYSGCLNTIDPLCFGDGTFAACPCANYGTTGAGCRNSAGNQGASLTSTGSPNPDTLQLTSSSEPSTSTSIFLQSDVYRPTIAQIGDGVLCLGGTTRRLYLKTASGGTVQAPQAGDPSISQRSAALGDPLAPGSVRFYQVWYRDTAPFCMNATYNFSNGLRVVW